MSAGVCKVTGQPEPRGSQCLGVVLSERLSQFWHWARPCAGCWGSGQEGDTALTTTSSLSEQGKGRSRSCLPEGSVGSGGPCSPSPEGQEAGWVPAGESHMHSRGGQLNGRVWILWGLRWQCSGVRVGVSTNIPQGFECLARKPVSLVTGHLNCKRHKERETA